MMKQFKKILCCLILLITMFATCNKVFAFTVGEYFHKPAGTSTTFTNMVKAVDGNKVTGSYSNLLWNHVGTSKNTGYSYSMYCIDPSRQGYSGSNANYWNYKVTELLSTSNRKHLAIMYIIKADVDDYYAKSLAIRTLTASTGWYAGPIQDKEVELQKAYYNSVSWWLLNEQVPIGVVNRTLGLSLEDCYKNYKNDASKRLSCLNSNNDKIRVALDPKAQYGDSYKKYALNDGSLTNANVDGTVKTALDLFIEAVKYADSYINQTSGKMPRTLTLTKSKPDTTVHDETCHGNYVDVKVSQSFKINAKNFLATKAIYPEDALTLVFNINGADGLTVKKDSIKIQFKTDGIDWTEYQSTAKGDASDTKFLDYIVSDNQDFQFRVSFEGISSTNGSINFSITANGYTRYYKKNQSFNGAYLIATIGGSAEADYQRFLIGAGDKATLDAPDNIDVNGEIKVSFKPICHYCTEFEGQTFDSKSKCEEFINGSEMADRDNAMCVTRNKKVTLVCSTICEDHVGEAYTNEIKDLVAACQKDMRCEGLMKKLRLSTEREARKVNRSIDGETITCKKYLCKDYEGNKIESLIVDELIMSSDISAKRELKNILGLEDILQAEIMTKEATIDGAVYSCGCTTQVLKTPADCNSYLKTKKGQPTYENAYCDKNVFRCSKPEPTPCVDKDMGTEGKCKSYLDEVNSYTDKQKKDNGYKNPTCVGSKFYCDNDLKLTCEKDYKGVTASSTAKGYIATIHNESKTLKERTTAANKLASLLKLINTEEAYKFLVEDGNYVCTGTKVNPPICTNKEGKTFDSKSKCEEYITKNPDEIQDIENARCVKPETNGKWTLMCSGKEPFTCESLINSGNKCLDSQNALKDFYGETDVRYLKSYCLDEETLICNATCDSLLHTVVTDNGEKVEVQKSSEYKGQKGLNVFNAILSLYDSLFNRDPKEVTKSGLNKENPSDEHVVCNVCANFEGQAVTAEKTLEYYKYQVSNPEEVYNEGGVVACHKDFCKSKPDTNDTEAYKKWLKECCHSSETHFSVEDACKADRDAKSEVDENKTWCEIFDQYCVCNPRTDLTSVCTEHAATDEEVELSTKTRNGHINELQNDANISMCIIDDEDHHLTKDKNNDPQTYNAEKNTGNPYCQVYCKEDYDFNIPTGRYTINGQYFAMGMQITSTRSCYTNKVDYDKFIMDMQDPSVDQAKAVKYINQCAAGWDTDHKSDATITFDYNENNNEVSQYIQMIPSGELKFVKSSEVDVSVNKSICNNSYISNDYTACGSGKFNEDIKMLDINGYKYPERFTYAKQIISKTTNYVPQSIFYTEASTGVIKVSEDGEVTSKYTVLEARLAKDRNLEIPETGAVPVTLKTDAGVYNYKFNITKLGEYFNGNKTTGRLLDSSDKNKLIFNKNIYTDINGENGFTGKYVCAYVVSCPECKVTCVPKPELGLFCDIPGIESCPDGADCPLICKDGNCAYDTKHGIQYTVHQVSLIDFTNETREIGANWSGVKGEAAAAEIVAKSDTALETPEYTFEFTPAVITEIRNLNKNTDSYAADSEDYPTMCKKYSKVLEEQGYSKEEIKNMVGDYDYQVCQSSLLTYLNSNKTKFKIETSLAGRKATKGFLSSDYCKNNACAIVGAVGPAWK